MRDDFVLIDLSEPVADPDVRSVIHNLFDHPRSFNPLGIPTDLEAAIGKQNNASITVGEVLARVETVMARNLPSVALLQRYCTPITTAVICGDGPSLADHIETVRDLQAKGAAVISVNKTHDYLIDHGIVPWAHVLLDANLWVAGYVEKPQPDVRYLVASQCHESVFDALAGYPVYVWHCAIDSDGAGDVQPVKWLIDHYPQHNPNAIPEWHAIPGGTTVGLRTPILLHSLVEAVDFHMIGFDSSRKAGKMHTRKVATRTDIQEGEVTMTTKLGLRETFETNSHMAKQVLDFKDLIENQLPERVRQGAIRPLKFTFYGDGLLPSFAATYHFHADREMNEKWGGKPERSNVTLHLDRLTKRLRSFTMLTPAMLDYHARMSQRYLRSVH